MTADKGSYYLLSLSGRLDASTSPSFDAEAAPLTASPAKDVVLDLRGLEYVSSSGLRSFLSLAKALQKGGFRTAFCSLSPATRDVFRIAGFMSILKILPDETAAAAELKG
ncbi:MAG: STAS domain-containing protein [Deltaproteobacteria bacterium]|nr:STAS domain-containing protein [Deltaproteobacteria bacterium]